MSATCLGQFVLTPTPSTYWRAFTYLQTPEVHYLLLGGEVISYQGHLVEWFLQWPGYKATGEEEPEAEANADQAPQKVP